MDYITLEKILSRERLTPYLTKHKGDYLKALNHYKANIRISESFYSSISVLEVGLRNNIDKQLKRKYSAFNWYDQPDFIRVVSGFQTDRIRKAKERVLQENKEITPGRIIAELTFGFRASFFDAKFERILWKDLRLVFPKCPKSIRQRRTVCSKLNSIRKLRNRIFHHEAISWNIDALNFYRREISEGISWLDGDLTAFFSDTFRIEDVLIAEHKNIV